MVSRRSLILAAAGSPFSASMARAQTWPDRPIRMVVAYPAGGGLDLVGRTVAARLSELLGQQVIVDNRGGASGAIGADAVAKAPPDGYTLLMASPAEVVVGPAAGQKTPYDPERDFVPVALVGETPLVLVAHPSVQAKTLKDLIAFGKAHPGQLTYGTPGTGSSMQFAGESLNARTNVGMTHIPYRGAAPAINDALGNQVNLAIVGMPPVVAHVHSGRLRALAVTTASRSNVMPEVPAVSEYPGLSDYRFTNWMAVLAPAKTPRPIVERLSAEIGRMCQEDAFKKRLDAAGVIARGEGSAGLAEFLASERTRYGVIAKERSIRFAE